MTNLSLPALLLLGVACGAAQASSAAAGATGATRWPGPGRALQQGGTRNCSGDADLQELLQYLGQQFEVALEDALASGLLSPPAQYIAGRVATLYVGIHSGDVLPESCNLMDAADHAMDALRDAASAASEKFCEEDYAAGILGLNISNAAATLEKAGVQERLESQGANATVAWATKLLSGTFGYAVQAFSKVCTTLPGVDYTSPTQTCDPSGCSGGSGSGGTSGAGGTGGLDPSILGVPDSSDPGSESDGGQAVAALVAPDHGALVGIP